MSTTSRGTRPSALWRAGRWLRHLPDRWLHARRRRMAISGIAAMPPVQRVLVVCHGNICRSPYAEAVLRIQLEAAGRGEVPVSSAGFIGPDRPAPATACEAAAARGVDLEGHRSRQLAPDELTPGTLVLVMNSMQMDAVTRLRPRGVETLLLGDLDPNPIERRAIPDPIDQSREVFEQVYDRIDRCVGSLVAALRRSSVSNRDQERRGRAPW